jgi:LPS export ABC transporter protein LptC
MSMRRITQTVLALLFFALVVEVILISPTEVPDKSPTAGTTIEATVQPKIENEKSAISDDPSQVQQQMEGVHVVETRNENKEWEMWANRAVGFKTQGDLAVNTVKASFFADNGVSFLVTGDKGAVETATKNMVVNGNVITTSSNGYVFRTETVEYNSLERSLRSQTPVSVKGPRDNFGSNLAIEGKTMNANLAEGQVTISNDVKARKRVRPNEDMIITANQAELYGHSREVKFSGKVIIDMHGVRISGPDAIFHYEQGQDLPETVSLSGGVKVSDVDKWATSERLNINLAKNQFIFDGQPRVVQDNDELRGDRIVFLDGGKQVRVQNA